MAAAVAVAVLLLRGRRAEEEPPSGPLSPPPMAAISSATSVQDVNGKLHGGTTAPIPSQLLTRLPPAPGMLTVQLDSPEAKGLVVIFHGCSHDAMSFVTLPEQRAWLDAAGDLGLAAVALTSRNRASGCWSDSDTGRVRGAMSALLDAKPRWRALPLLAVGISSGGFLLRQLVQGLPSAPRGLIFVVSSAPGLEAADARGMPPSVFAHMPKDSRTASAVASNLATLKQAGVLAAEMKADPLPLTAEWLAGRPVSGMTHDVADTIVEAYPQRSFPHPTPPGPTSSSPLAQTRAPSLLQFPLR